MLSCVRQQEDAEDRRRDDAALQRMIDELLTAQQATDIGGWGINGHTGGCTLTVKPVHKGDLTPAASVEYAGSALTLVAVEAVAR